MSTAGCTPGDRALIQIAPMMEVTYRDFRYFMRLLTRRAQLWTEMVVDDTLLHNLEPQKCDRFLAFDKAEHPVVCQLGGSDAAKLTQAAEVVERYGYDEVNLNCGCPSSRVAGKGEFGCSLMLKKEAVRDIIHSMSRAVQIPVTVKCRLGCDDHDSPEFTRDFVRAVAQGGCRHFIIHARKAWLNGLSPAQNRSIPPLHYPRILDLCRAFPDLQFSLNGGVQDVSHARALLGLEDSEALVARAWELDEGVEKISIPSNFHGVMIGRGAMNTPCLLWDIDHQIYREDPPVQATRRSLLEGYRDYLQDAYPPGDADRSVGSVHMAVKPTLGLFAGLRGNRAYRNTLDKLTRDADRRLEGPAHCLEEAMRAVEESNPGILDEPLAPTQTYRPGKKGSSCEDVPGANKVSARERKRKAAADRQEGAPTSIRRTDAAVPVDIAPAPCAAELEVAGSCGVAGVATSPESSAPPSVAVA